MDEMNGCPEHLIAALEAAQKRWATWGGVKFRAHQAGEVLRYAADCFESRSWGEADHLAAAQLGAWLAELAVQEDAAQRAAAAAAPAADITLSLTSEEIELVLAARAAKR